MNEASQALPAKAESEPATWPTAMAESKRISPRFNDDAPVTITPYEPKARSY